MIHGKRFLLIVEDTPSISHAYSTLFHLVGIHCQVVSSLMETRLVLNDRELSSQIDAILLDLMLSDGSGETLIEEFSMLPQHPRIVINSARVIQEDRAALMRAGVSAILVKPSEFNDLCLAAFPDFLP